MAIIFNIRALLKFCFRVTAQWLWSTLRELSSTRCWRICAHVVNSILKFMKRLRLTKNWSNCPNASLETSLLRLTRLDTPKRPSKLATLFSWPATCTMDRCSLTTSRCPPSFTPDLRNSAILSLLNLPILAWTVVLLLAVSTLLTTSERWTKQLYIHMGGGNVRNFIHKLVTFMNIAYVFDFCKENNYICILANVRNFIHKSAKKIIVYLFVFCLVMSEYKNSINFEINNMGFIRIILH